MQSIESTPLTSLELKVLSEHELRLVRGTYRAMAEIGTQQLSLRGIAKQLQVSPALLVYHFGSRDNLLVETMHWALASTVRRIERRVAGVGDPHKALATILDAVFVGPKANRDFYLIYMDLVQYAVRHEGFTELAALLHQHINGSYAAIVRMGVDAGVWEAPDVDLTATHMRSIVDGGFIQWLQRDDWEQTHAALQRDCHAAILRMLEPR